MAPLHCSRREEDREVVYILHMFCLVRRINNISSDDLLPTFGPLTTKSGAPPSSSGARVFIPKFIASTGKLFT